MMGESIESIEMPLKYKNILSTFLADDDLCKISAVSVNVPDDLVKAPMASDYEMVTVTFKREGALPLELFTKKRLPKGTCPILNGQWKAVMLNEGIFLREFMEEMKTFCENHSQDGLQNLIDIFPRTFFYDNQMVVMENLTKRGFVTLANRDEQKFEHAELVLKNMAKLHAISHLMIEKEGGETKFLQRYSNFECALLKPQLMQFFAKAFESALDFALDTLKRSINSERKKAYEYLEKWQGKLAQRLIEIIKSKSPFSCVCHGNLCGDNIMFHEDGLRTQRLVFVDLQMARVGSPTADIGYYLFRSVEQKARGRWKELLKIYFEMLQTHENYLGHSLHLEYKDFVKDFILKAEMGFLFGIFFARGVETNSNNSLEETSERIVALVNDYKLLVTG